jgi:hypothetical protein
MSSGGSSDYLEENAEWVHLPILKYFGASRSAALEGFVQAHEEYRRDFPGLSE